ncbi:hypothetical protein AA313_de0200954 [Arthrobotrys entomopaga]|nr:hypothetical protein AA313_de0200954 [Arthrobotrys entomopaga]
MTTSVLVFPELLAAFERQAQQVPPKDRTRYTTDIERIQMITLLSVGYKSSEIGTKFGVGRATANRILKKAISRGYDEKDYTSLKMEHIKDDGRTGRPAKATPAVKEKIVEMASVKEKSGQRANTLQTISDTFGLSRSLTGRIIKLHKKEKRRKPTPTKAPETSQAPSDVPNIIMQGQAVEENQSLETNNTTGSDRAVDSDRAPETRLESISNIVASPRTPETEASQSNIETNGDQEIACTRKEADRAVTEISQSPEEANRAPEIIKLAPIRC